MLAQLPYANSIQIQYTMVVVYLDYHPKLLVFVRCHHFLPTEKRYIEKWLIVCIELVWT